MVLKKPFWFKFSGNPPGHFFVFCQSGVKTALWFKFVFSLKRSRKPSSSFLVLCFKFVFSPKWSRKPLSSFFWFCQSGVKNTLSKLVSTKPFFLFSAKVVLRHFGLNFCSLPVVLKKRFLVQFLCSLQSGVQETPLLVIFVYGVKTAF